MCTCIYVLIFIYCFNVCAGVDNLLLNIDNCLFSENHTGIPGTQLVVKEKVLKFS